MSSSSVSSLLPRGLRLSLVLAAGVLATACSDSDKKYGSDMPETTPTAETIEFPVTLTGVEEVPAVVTDASGMGVLVFETNSAALAGSVTVVGIEATEAHINSAFAGANGGMVFPLEEVTGSPGVWQVPANTFLSAAEKEILLNGGMYVNVHSNAFPNGEVRGQILPENMSVLWQDLSGENEIPAVSTTASGRAAVTLDSADKTVVVHAMTMGLPDAGGAHIHQAFAGMNGEIVMDLMQSAENMQHWMLEETELTDEQYQALLTGEMYINVHTPTNQGGELRGQILPSDLSVHWVPLSGDQEVPPVTTDATGRAAVTLNSSTKEMVLRAMTTGVADATAAHIHEGAVGVNGGVMLPLTQNEMDPNLWMLPKTVLTQAQYDALLAGNTYVNVHTLANSGGEIRGQITP